MIGKVILKSLKSLVRKPAFILRTIMTYHGLGLIRGSQFFGKNQYKIPRKSSLFVREEGVFLYPKMQQF